MTFYYLIINGNSSENLHWETISNRAKNDKDHNLANNYSNIKLEQYEHMIIHMLETKPVAFHGIFNNGRWPSNVSRVCNRMYVDRDHRDIMGTIPGDAARYDFTNYEQWGKDVLFISRGVQYDNPELSFKKFKKFVLWLRKVTGVNLEYDDRLYQCCNNMTKDCYQFCVWYDPKHIRHTLDIASMSMEDWSMLPEDSCV